VLERKSLILPGNRESAAAVKTARDLSPQRQTNSAWEYGIAAVAALAVFMAVFHLWRTDLSVPFSYSGDALGLGAGVKGLSENSWYTSNPALGAPFGQEGGDYPVPDLLHLGALKLLSLLGQNFAFTMNLYYCLSFPLTAIIALAVFRRYGISFLVSLVFSLLFAFLPYHIYRGTTHLFLACYFTLPLIFVTALELAAGETIVQRAGSGAPRGLALWKTVAIALVTGASGLYYAFFATYLTFVAGMLGGSRRRSWRPVIEACLVCGLLLVVLVGATAPSLIYRYQHGGNAVAAQRNPAEAEFYGLRLTQLLLPIPGHRLPLLRDVRHEYDQIGTAIPPNENSYSSLGFTGTAGLLLLIVVLLTDPPRGPLIDRLRALSVLNIAAVALATMGGFSTIVAFTITSGIRGYNRISPFIGFLCLFGLALVADTLARRSRHRRAIHAALACLLVLGLLDQTPFEPLPSYAETKARFGNDDLFVTRIESSLPGGSMIFQLPFMHWPENGSLGGMPDYEPLRGYLHSKALRWSYGAMRGRYADSWLEKVSAQPVPELLSTLAVAGFSGISVDVLGYEDRAAKLIAQLRGVLNEEPITNGSDLFFFDVRAFAKRLKNQYKEGDWQTFRQGVLSPVAVSWTQGCSVLEGSSAALNWRWCGSTAELALENVSTETRRITISMDVEAARQEASTLRVSSPVWNQRIAIPSRQSAKVHIQASAPPGRTAIRFVSDARKLLVPGDSRTLVFRFLNFRIAGAEDSSGVIPEWNGCYSEEAAPPERWRWCTDSADLSLTNTSSRAADILLTMAVQDASGQGAHVRLEAPGSTAEVVTGPIPPAIVQRLVLAPGTTRVHIASDAHEIIPSGDARKIGFRISNFAILDLTSTGVLNVN
jgi:phosphoglycerol transferase